MTQTRNWARLDVPPGMSLDIALPETHDVVADDIRVWGKYFPPHFELALELASPAGTILDLGAHFGTFTLAAAARGHRVIAVEASPRNIDLLCASARANSLDDSITIVQAAVGNVTGAVRFHEEGAWGQVVPSGPARDAVTVPARTVTEILADLGVSRVDLVKMDIEGFEIAAIEGMAPLLAFPNAPGVVYECNAHTLRMFDQTPQQLVSTLARFGYDNYLVGERELTPVTPASFQPETNVDYVAVKGTLDSPPSWRLRRRRTENELARVVTSESRHVNVHHRAQLARSLERAPAIMLARRDVQLALSALALDPDEAVARSATWWGRRHPAATPAGLTGLTRAQHGFHVLAEQGRALRDRLEQIRIRWGARP
jgi:FkbM family methyltransferase